MFSTGASSNLSEIPTVYMTDKNLFPASNSSHVKKVTQRENTSQESAKTQQPSAWMLSSSSGGNYPKTCYSKAAPSKKRDPLLEKVSNLSTAVTESLRNDSQKKDLQKNIAEKKENENKSVRDEEDEIFGKLEVLQLAKIGDENLKEQKKGLISKILFGSFQAGIGG